MEIRQLKYFIEVAKLEHVTHAAESLHVAQSAVSRQISLLEDELSVSLFTREGRNVKLTQMGRLFLTYAERCLNELELAKQQIQEYLNPDVGMIRLGFSSGLSVQTLPPVLTEFRASHPGLHFQLQQGTTHQLFHSLESGEIDLAFSSPVPSDHPTIKGTTLYTENLVALLPSDHPFSDRDGIRLRDFRNQRFVTYSSGLALRELVSNACATAGFEPKIAFEGEDMDTIKGLVASGFGISLIPEHALAYNLPADLKAIPILEPKVNRTVGLIFPKNRELAPSEKLLFEFLVSFYKKVTHYGWS